MAESTASVPPPGWWREIAVSDFEPTLAEYGKKAWDRDMIVFTHVVSVRGIPIGEAAAVEQIATDRHVGLFRIGHLPVVYGMLDGRFECWLKP